MSSQALNALKPLRKGAVPSWTSVAQWFKALMVAAGKWIELGLTAAGLDDDASIVLKLRS
jgi:hypothetical protein